MLKYLLFIALLLFTACGGSSDSQNNEQPNNNSTEEPKITTEYATFLDSYVIGAKYDAGDGITGITDKYGVFKYQPGKKVRFYIGDIYLGEAIPVKKPSEVIATTDKIITPLELANTTDINNSDALKITRLLMSLDRDKNATNGIDIDTTNPILKQKTTILSDELTLEETFSSLDIIDEKNAFEHLCKSLNKKCSQTNIQTTSTDSAADTTETNTTETNTTETNTTETNTTQTNPTPTKLQVALSSADASLVDENTLYEAIEKEAKEKLNLCIKTEKFLYPNGLEKVDFPEVRSDYFTSTSTKNIPLHIAKNNANPRVYSYIGEKDDTTRYAVLGANIFKFDSQEGYQDINNDLNQELKNSTTQLFKWLLKLPVDANIFEKDLTIVVNSNYMKDSLTDWLSDNHISAPNWKITTDTSLLNTNNYDIYIAVDENTQNYKIAIENQKPVIVFQNWIVPASEMLSYFDIKWRWYKGTTVGDWDSIEELCKTATPEVTISKTVQNLKDHTLNFNYTDTACPNSFGTITCKDDLLLNSNGKTLAEEFSNGANLLRDMLIAQDLEGKNIFKLSSGYDFLKLNLLLADKFRKEISYPMDKISTDDTIFFKALFADHCINYARDNNSFQPDLGDFTHDVTALRSLPKENGSVTMTPTIYSEWSSTGFYAIPGSTITIKRTDETDNKIQIKFNMLRPGTSRIWNQNAYNRPKYIASNPINIETKKEYHISTPIGGPIYIHWQGVSTNPQPFTIEFKNIVKFPSLMSIDSKSIDDFKSQLSSSVFDWIDIKTPYVEIHTLKSKFDEAYTTGGYFPYNGDLTQYLEDINKYLVINNLNLAGFKGNGLSLTPQVQEWCSSYNIDCSSDIHKKPKIQHINADIFANCGAGCSGNPFDTSWGIQPTGWGDSHEYGHNLQRYRLKIYNTRSTEVSNNIFPLHTNWQYLVDHNIQIHPDIKTPNNKNAYEILQDAIKNNTSANINHPMWIKSGTYDNCFDRLSFYNQLVFIHNSWDIYTKLYILDRLFDDAISDATKWESNKDILGFSNYSIDEAKDINGNDFMAITLSKFTQKDHRAYFEAWGIEVSQKAKDQIDTNGFASKVPLDFYIVKDNKQTKTFPTKTLPLDGIIAKEINISGTCSEAYLSKCSQLNGYISYPVLEDNSIYFLSRWSENGPATSIADGNPSYTTLKVNAVDDKGDGIVIKLRAAKVDDNNIYNTTLAMNDTTKLSSSKTGLLIWIDPSDNSLEQGKIYHITDDLYIDVKDDKTTIDRIKLNIKDIILPTYLTFDDPSSTLVRGYPEIEDSSTYFVTTSSSQGPTKGVWENNTGYTTLNIKVKDSHSNSYNLKLRAQRDAYCTDGTCSTKVIMNSGIIYGKDNALVITYNKDDNPTLTSGETYTASELLIIDAKLWHANRLRERLYIDISITAP